MEELRFPKEILETPGDGKARVRSFLYNERTAVIEDLLETRRCGGPLDRHLQILYDYLEGLFNRITEGEFVFQGFYGAGEGYYLPMHILNVLLLSSFIGIKAGLTASKMKELGLACILCDAGLDSFRGIVNQPRKLSQEENLVIRGHISASLRIADKLGQVSPAVYEAVRTHHERADGSGYPKGLKSREIGLYANIIGLADTFEAISHGRPYRAGCDAHSSIKLMMESLKDKFDYEVIKLLVNSLSIYPLGMDVILDTEEIATVIESAAGSPLKPIVRIMRDIYGNPVQDREIVDLSLPDAPCITGVKLSP
ncbi:MAG: HD domain-containing phosphohydrolase [Candidatus Omnitrophota bacterium]